jgi:hypothetical protein
MLATCRQLCRCCIDRWPSRTDGGSRTSRSTLDVTYLLLLLGNWLLRRIDDSVHLLLQTTIV